MSPPEAGVREIVFPSGRTVPVVRFNNSGVVQQGLHICPDCWSGLVQPIDWSEAPGDCWNLLLKCPNCDWYTEGLYTADECRELEDQLDEGLADMLRDLQRLTQKNMSDQIDRFVAALKAKSPTGEDLVLPGDITGIYD